MKHLKDQSERLERVRSAILHPTSKKTRCRPQAQKTDSPRESLGGLSGVGFFVLFALSVFVPNEADGACGFGYGC